MLSLLVCLCVVTLCQSVSLSVCRHTSGQIGERVINRVGGKTWGWDKQVPRRGGISVSEANRYVGEAPRRG